ncbi:MAG: DinB family protein [Bosea sp. (in: a-proteobacteria)]|uniref:DinB family protein n=1 Tax=Bosea sp. (in: a-proteobacteria) TaxID=1871050 RepID=UPI00273380E7|nr:DinB family protein [Bosea sp. (in: a-proteobacteria)]MDP3257441.1 DinB family protein [Bosea sp. (in: a-proteobacteria)]MDP3318821.1 DinB family protein [Bosea sp. (in: a-proteobacteria)]
MDELRPYRAMAFNNLWANHRLLRACAGLSQAEWVAPRTGFFPSLRATLNHILILDHFYVDAMEGGRLGPAAWADREPCATLPELQVAQEAMDRRLIAVVEAAGPAADTGGLARIVSVHRGARIQRERLDRLLLHLFQHQIHHRGQAHAMLSGTSVRPPQLDEFFSAEEADLRAGEFAALGLSEARVWGGTVDAV